MVDPWAAPPDQDPDLAWRASFFDMLWTQDERPGDFAHPGWSIYRNTTQRTCLNALAANHPALAMLCGEASFGLLARAYLQAHPPGDARLLHLGSHMADFLRNFEPAADWPHLVEVAWLDRLWTESHVAADAPVLTAQDVLEKGLDPQRICPPHPASRWLWSEWHPIATLWLDARAGLAQRSDLNWTGEGLLLTRPEGHVQASRLDRAGASFLEACHQGKSLAQSMAQAMAADATCDLSALVAHMLEQGALTHPTPPIQGDQHE